MIENYHVSSLSLISSSICNLNCSFCYLHKNESYKKYNKLVREAWQNGDYLKNLYNTCKALELDFNEIDCIQLWGGETLLTVQDITPNLKQIYNMFPNINNWRISTNWVINILNFFEFLKEIDNNTNQAVIINLQTSIDGPEGEYTEQGHNGSWEIYRKNFKDFTTMVNNYKFKNLSIEININATVGKELYLTNFSDKDKMLEYIKGMMSLTKEIEQNCISSALKMRQIEIFPGYALPYNSSTAEGEKYAEICRLWERVKIEEFPYLGSNAGFYFGTGDIVKNKDLFSDNSECGELKCGLTINYDGSICECNGSFIDNFEDYQKELLSEGKLDEYYTTKMRDYIHFNPGKATKEEIENYKWYILYGYKNNCSTYIHLAMAMVEELALSGQIPYKYYTDKELALRHLSTLLNLASCTRENLRDTKIPYLTLPACFRRNLNGVMDLAYTNTKNSLWNEMKYCISRPTENSKKKDGNK